MVYYVYLGNFYRFIKEFSLKRVLLVKTLIISIVIITNNTKDFIASLVNNNSFDLEFLLLSIKLKMFFID
jgi:hypothetical protein